MHVIRSIANIVALVTVGIISVAWADAPTITDVIVKQRYPWNGKVDITYTLTGNVTSGLPSDKTPVLLLSATNRLSGTSYMASEAALSGDTGTAGGAHHVVWDLNAQGLGFKSDDVVFTVTYVERAKQYCVIDLSAGVDAVNYPVMYMEEPPSGGFNTDEYKTTKLVLRLIEPGSFIMGGLYAVTLTKPFYCGVFEVTQKQYMLVAGSNPSTYKGDMRPVERMPWVMIRGDYPDYNHYYLFYYNYSPRNRWLPCDGGCRRGV